MKYSEKLRDPRWQRKRLEVMERDKFTCLACDDTKSTLNVHHMQYHGDPWDAPMGALETLCEKCHETRSQLNKLFMLQDSRTVVNCLRPIVMYPNEAILMLWQQGYDARDAEIGFQRSKGEPAS